ncbi:MAG: alpha/beta hydrolase [Rhizobacter sp.]|nr:alpha/beta hydrolase [Rhizobacter sp.]
MRRFCKLLLWIAAPLAASALLFGAAPVATLNAIASVDGPGPVRSVAYGPLARQQLDVYRPGGIAPAAGWPAVVFFSGGSWNRGERADCRFVGAALASRGLLTLVADYRLYPEVRYPGFLHDCALATSYGLRHAAALGGDPRRVFLMGHSAGAYNAAMIALDPRWLAARGRRNLELAGWIGLAGPYDFLPMRNLEAQPVFFHPDYPAGSQPIEHATAGTPRALLVAASADILVDPQRNSVGLAARLRAAGVPVQLQLHERVDHVTLLAAIAAPLRWLAPVLDGVVSFIDA